MKSDYKPTIGLEVHAGLKTESKMFCGCTNNPNEQKSNVNVCPICLGHPGVLPTINKKAVELMVRIGFALGGQILKHSHFDRKSYFYPDLPKGYQISQYEFPFVKGGKLSGIELTRIHLEEDAGRLVHAKNGTLVDFNRAGVPLMELVTEPVIYSADDAVKFARELQLILKYLDASEADMEKGLMRVEANISVAPKNSKKLGTKVEVKNINSFKAVRGAIEFEIERQKKLISEGKKIKQETRGWDENKNETVAQRSKEEADDYRYMPEPDLPPVDFTDKEGIDIESLKSSIPELPEEKRKRFNEEFGLHENQIHTLVADKNLAAYFEETVSEIMTMESVGKKEIQLAVNYLTSDLVGIFKEHGISISEVKISPENFAELIVLTEKGTISSRAAKDVLREMFETQKNPSDIVKEKNLGQISDESEIIKVVLEVIKENDKAVGDYKNGKETAIKFLIGSAMARLRGRGNPELLEKLFQEHLSK